MSRISIEDQRIARKNLFGSIVFVTLSLAGLIPAFGYLTSEFASSGFGQYLTLIFSDAGTLIVFWKDFLLSLMESLPVLGLSLVFFFVLLLLVSLRTAGKLYQQRVYSIVYCQ